MVTLRLPKTEVEHLILWTEIAKDQAFETRVPFQGDEEALLEKLRAACGYSGHVHGGRPEPTERDGSPP